MNLLEATLDYFNESKIALVNRFIPYYVASACCHVMNLENQKREFFLEHGRVANMRLHMFMCAPPGFMKSLILQKFMQGSHSAFFETPLKTEFEGSMCLPSGQNIQTSAGALIPVEQIKLNTSVVGHDLSEGVVTNALSMRGNIVRIQTRTGRQLLATDNHPILTFNGWKQAGSLSYSDRVAIPRYLKINAQPTRSAEWFGLLGFFLADGNFAQNTFACAYEDILNEVQILSKRTGFSIRPTKHVPAIEYILADSGSGHAHRFTQWIKELGLKNAVRNAKFVPNEVFTQDNDRVAMFLRYLLLGDGYISPKEMTLSNLSENIIRSTQSLLIRFSIVSKVWYDGVNRCWKLRVTGADSLKRLYSSLHIDINVETGKYETSHIDTIPPEVWHDIEIARQKENLSWYALNLATGWSVAQSKYYAQSIPYIRLQSLKQYLPSLRVDDTIVWDSIASLSPQGEDDVYNLSVEPQHTFIANDIITHNTEAGFSGSVKLVDGEAVAVYGAAYEHRESIMGIEEFAALTNVMKQEHSVNLDNAMLTALDSGLLVKRLAMGVLRYVTQVTLWSGSQPARFDLTSGLGRRLCFIYFIPTKSEENLIRLKRREAKNISISDTVLYRVRNAMESTMVDIGDIKGLKFDDSLYRLFDQLQVPHYEEAMFERLAIGYTLATLETTPEVLTIEADHGIADLIKQEHHWRQQIKKGAEFSEVLQVIKEMNNQPISAIKSRLVNFGIEYSHATNLLKTMQNLQLIRMIEDPNHQGPGRRPVIVIITED